MPHDPNGRRDEWSHWRSNEPRGFRAPHEHRRVEERTYFDDDRERDDDGRFRRGEIMSRREAEDFSRRIGEGEWGWQGRGHRDHPDHDRPYGRDERYGLIDQARDTMKSWFGADERRPRPDERGYRYVRGDGDGHRDPHEGGGHQGRGPKGYMRSDQRIEEDVCERLTLDPYLDASGIEVRVVDREVILAGSVATRDDKRRAERLAEDTAGVEQVQNGLRVDSVRAASRVEGTYRGSEPVSFSADGGNQEAAPLVPRGRPYR